MQSHSRPGIIELREFYATPRGRLAAAQISRALTSMQRCSPPPPNLVETPLVAFGYAVPVLDAAPVTAVHLMPQTKGYHAWPEAANSRTQLCDEASWPLADDSAGAILLMHAIEHSADPVALLAEAWRVLAPQGRLWLVVPNRRSQWFWSWAQAESTPFGRGQPYSARQLRDLLITSLFVPESWRRALFAPPVKSRLGLAAGPLCEAILSYLAPLSGGVILLRAVKQLQAPVGLTDAAKTRDFQLNLSNAVPT